MPELAATPADFDLARTALLEITGAETIGGPLGFVDEGDGVITVHLASLMRGYPDWRWTVSIARIDDAEPTVLETELTPGDGALLAPAWVPWEDRVVSDDPALDSEEEPEDEDEDDSDDDDEDESDEDDDDSDDDESDDDSDDDETADEDDDPALVLLHAGDLDGVDIDEIETDLEEGAPEDVGTDGTGLDAEAQATARETGSGDEEDDMDDDVMVDHAGDDSDDGPTGPGAGPEVNGSKEAASEETGHADSSLPADEVTMHSIPEDGITVDGVSTTDAPTEDIPDDAGEGLRGTLAAE
jgi:hypothetical protein